MKGIFISLAFCLLLCAVVTLADQDIKKSRVLVLLDNLAIKSTHSEFFNLLKNNGYVLDIKAVNSGQWKLKEFGEYNYDQLILFCTSENEPKILKQNQVLEFFDDGGNILIAGDVDTSKFFRQLVTQIGVEFDAYGSKVYDHQNAVEPLDDGLFKTENLIDQPAFSPQVGPVLYRGIGQTLTVYENFQVYGLLRGNKYTYSRLSNGANSEVVNSGQNIVLVSGIQGRNNARVVITGSLDLFSNELFFKSNGVNRRYADNIVAWNFLESGVLKLSNVKHYLQGDKNETRPFNYKVLDDLSYRCDIATWDRKSQKWVPYVASDLQLEFVMLDPYIRMPLTHVDGTFTYKADFKVPDKYGVFSFKINYRKPGFSFISNSTVVPVRPFNHNEHDRFIFSASPYYVTVFTTMAGFFVFVLYFLFDGAAKGKKQ